MQPITYFTDSAAARSFARVYGDRLQILTQPERMYILLSLALSLFTDESIANTMADLDEEGDMPEALVEHLFEEFNGQDEQTLIGMIQAAAMALGVAT